MQNNTIVIIILNKNYLFRNDKLFIEFNVLTIKTHFFKTAVVFIIENILTKAPNLKINTSYKINNMIVPRKFKITTLISIIGPYYIFN